MPDRIIRWVGQQIQPLGNEAAQAQGRDIIGGADSAAGRLGGAAGATTGFSGMKYRRERGLGGGANKEAPHEQTPLPAKGNQKGRGY